MKFNYTRTHFPTGTVVKTDMECSSELEFLRFLNQWNGQGNGVYLYTSNDAQRPVFPAAHDFKSSVLVKQDRTPEAVATADGYWTPT